MVFVAGQQILQYFGIEPFKDNLPFFVSLVVCVILASELIIKYFKEKDEETLDQAELERSSPEALAAELEAMAKKGYNEKILRARDAFSRTFMIEQKIPERIVLGSFAESAAIKIGDREKQAAILIDDLGYSYFLDKNMDLAMEKICHGLEVAESIPNYYWIAKAHRHKAAIFIERRNENAADAEINLAFDAANQITNEKDKNEMLGGLLYNEAQKALKHNQPEEALRILEESDIHRKFVGDRSRLVKIYALRGKIYEKLQDYAKAKDCFIQGLDASEKIERLDEVIRNHRGLSRIYDRENNRREADYHRAKAEELSQSIYVPFES